MLVEISFKNGIKETVRIDGITEKFELIKKYYPKSNNDKEWISCKTENNDNICFDASEISSIKEIKKR
jgi:hypothetical protein